MFLTPEIALANLALVLLAGAVLGAVTGWLLTLLIRPRRRNLFPDALLGSGSFLVIQVLYGLSDYNVRFVDGRALGWHGIVLNHAVALRVGLLLVTVAAWRLHKSRRAVGAAG